MSIPKIIHYCWFGRGAIPEREQVCMKSWKELLPYFEVKFWNEDSFDLEHAVPYVRECYEKKKFAFVSDYVRMYALYNYGGVYLDTDVEVIKPLDKFLEDDFFIGFENRTMVGTGIIGSKSGNWLLKEMIDYYSVRNFIDENGNMDVTTNVKILVGIIEKYGFVTENREQMIRNLHIYERDIFHPKKLSEEEFLVTERTITIHKMAGSWLTDRERRRGANVIWRNFFRPGLRSAHRIIQKILGEGKTKEIELMIRKMLR
jgi:mannosyltransferase OCH1-like enzyme